MSGKALLQGINCPLLSMLSSVKIWPRSVNVAGESAAIWYGRKVYLLNFKTILTILKTVNVNMFRFCTALAQSQTMCLATDYYTD